MNFDRLAPHYDWLEALLAGDRLQSARTAWLSELRGRRRILSVGEGHGRFAAACRARFPEADLTCVEASPGMLARAQRRLGPDAAQVTWHCGDVLAWDADGQFDAIVTCFFLDCFPPETLAAVVGHLARCATPGAAWLVVDFALPPRGLGRWRARAVHWLMYAFFHRVTGLTARRLTPPESLLRGHGFQLAARREFNWGLVRSDVWLRAEERSN
jgi:ubiquinone/menaquinone biosynthesis C-methylase UbiE